MESLVPILVQLVAGGAGGGILGQLMKSKSAGALTNIVAGAIGGVATGQGLDASGILAQLGPMLGGETVAGGVTALLGGGVLQAIAAQFLGKKAA